MSSKGHESGRRWKSKKADDAWGECGGYMNAKIRKLQDQFVDESACSTKKESNIFSGIAIFVNGFTKPPSDVLKTLMQEHGGTYHHYYGRDKVTHIIANNLPNSKIAALTDQKVVRPEWVTDSIAAKKLLPYQDYQLYRGSSNIQPSVKRHLSAQKQNLKQPGEKSNPSPMLSESPIFGVHMESETDACKRSCASSIEIDNKPEEASASFDNIASVNKQTKFHSPTKAGDATFVSDFYSNSRLHHLSTWGAEFKAYVGSLQETLTEFPGKTRLRDIAESRLKGQVDVISPSPRDSCGCVFMHIDMDCFFVSVGLRNKPHLKGKPVAVTHSRGKGRKVENEVDKGFNSMAEIASCSYEARACGVKNGMFMGPAKKLCPDLIPIDYDFEGYNQVSKILYDTVASVTCEMEAVSCDELFVDCTAVLEETGAQPEELAEMLRHDIERATQCTSSAGLGPNLLIARLATRKAKPNGQLFVSENELDLFISNQPVENLPGVGRKLRQKLHSLDIHTCADLHTHSQSALQKHFGPKMSETLYKFCRGLDERKIQTDKVRKSVSAEINYGIRFTDWEQADKFVKELSEEVTKRLRNIGSLAKTITLKLKIRSAHAPKETAKFLGHGICDQVSKAVTLPVTSDSTQVILKETLSILKAINPEVTDIRGIGIQLSRLEKSVGKKNTTSDILKYTCKQPPKEVCESAGVRDITLHNNPVLEESCKEACHSENITQDSSIATECSKSTLPPLPTLSNLVSPSHIIQKLALQSTTDENAAFSPHFSGLKRPQLSQNVVKNELNNVRIDSEPESVGSLEQPFGEVVVSPSKFLDLRTLKQASALSPQKSPAKRGRGRGRGAKTSHLTRKSPQAKRKQQIVESNLTKHPENDKQLKKQLFENREENVLERGESSQEGTSDLASSIKAKPNLCGATSLEEVKELMKQWTTSSEEPNDEDIALFSSYLIDLIDDKNLEQLFLLLKFLIRQVKRMGQKPWEQAVKFMIANVQEVIHCQYNSTLKISF